MMDAQKAGRYKYRLESTPLSTCKKLYARGKDSSRAQRRLAVWMWRSRLGATRARTERSGAGTGRGWVFHTELGRLAWTHKRLNKPTILVFLPGIESFARQAGPLREPNLG